MMCSCSGAVAQGTGLLPIVKVSHQPVYDTGEAICLAISYIVAVFYSDFVDHGHREW